MFGIGKRHIGMVLIVLFSCQQVIRAQFVEVRAELDTHQIRIGEPLYLNLQVIQPADVRVDFPFIADTLVDKLEVVRSWPADTVLRNGDIEIVKRYRLTSFDSGLYVIPPLKFHFQSSVWNDSVTSNPLYLLVYTVPVDSTIYDVKSPMAVPVSLLEVLPFALAGIVFLFAAGFLIWYLRRRSRNKPIFRPAKPEEPAHVIAFRELQKLREEKLWQKNEFKGYYSRLTEIIRRYMERRYGLPAMEMTSHEILDAWIRSGEDKEDLADKLSVLLNLADLVKFARQKPVASDNEENMERAYEFVEKTKYRIPENTEDHATGEQEISGDQNAPGMIKEVQTKSREG